MARRSMVMTPFVMTQFARFSLACLLLGGALAGWSHAQLELTDKFSGTFSGFGGSSGSSPVTVSAQFTVATSEQPAVLMITAEIRPGWHVYALTQPPGGPKKANIVLTPSDDVQLLGPFTPIPKYKSHIDDIAWIGLELQEHEGTVTWYAPIKLREGVEARQLVISGNLQGQACQDACIPVDLAFEARLGKGVPIGPLAFDESAPQLPAESAAESSLAVRPAATKIVPTLSATASQYRPVDSHITWHAELAPAVVRPGESATLLIAANCPANWHVYALADRDDQPGSKPTLITFETTSGLQVSRPVTDAPILQQDQSDIGWGIAHYHEGQVVWSAHIDIPVDTNPGSYAIRGLIGFQACGRDAADREMCETPTAIRFETQIAVDPDASPGSALRAPVAMESATYSMVGALAKASFRGNECDAAAGAAAAAGARSVNQDGVYDLSRIQLEEVKRSVLHYLVLGFCGGIILNLMPCVLPVIGLKIMSFVEQSGQSRRQALVLNLWYSAGIVSVFLILAALAIFVGLTWGGQFGNTTFNVILAVVVFAMALSLLGVWEIPIPGFFGSGKSQELANQEGPFGAFLKGVITTILATPCTGPFMAPAIGWAVGQSPTTILMVFTSVGLGMASPYLVIGAFPSLIRFLPRPGEWMITFRQIMGFVLLATVVFLISFIDEGAVVPTLILLLGTGIACWSVSRISLNAKLSEKLESWGLAGAIVLAAAVLGFADVSSAIQAVLDPGKVAAARSASDSQPWQPFTLESLQQEAVVDGRTVLVDFSAEWCLTCKALEKTVLHTPSVERAIEESGVVTMYGDFTDEPLEIKQTFEALKCNGVPVIAIFPGGDPYDPIVFQGSYTKADLLGAIEEASGKGRSSTAMRVNASALNRN